MLLVANLANTKWTRKNDWSPCTWVLIWEYSARAIQWIPTLTWKGLDGFQKPLGPCALDESRLSIGRVNSNRQEPSNEYELDRGKSVFKLKVFQSWALDKSSRSQQKGWPSKCYGPFTKGPILGQVSDRENYQNQYFNFCMKQGFIHCICFWLVFLKKPTY